MQLESFTMVGAKCYTIQQLLTEKQLQHVVEACTGEHNWELVSCDLNQAVDGLAGFLGDHIRMKLLVRAGGHVKTLRLFMKRVPVENKPKADFINDNDFFRREVLMFKLADELGWAKGPHPWCTKAYLYSEDLVVMPDLSAEGYVTQPLLATFDLPHVLRTVESLARFHAAFANYEATRNAGHSAGYYTILHEYGHIITERIFKDGPWLHAAAKLTTNILARFSNKYKSPVQDLEAKLRKLYLEACDSLKEHEDTLNVLIHKDLWTNNIMFKHVNGAPTNTILIDFQCIRYGPPAFDIMSFLYLTTSRSFREKYEKGIFQHYYSIFCHSLEDVAKDRMKLLGYDEKEFLRWCEAGRQFAMFEAVGIYPFTLMDPKTAEATFDNPETYYKYIYEDRSAPVVEHAERCTEYRERQLETSEEFIERYVLQLI